MYWLGEVSNDSHKKIEVLRVIGLLDITANLMVIF